MDDLISRQDTIDAILHLTNCQSVTELYVYIQEHSLRDMWSGGVNDAISAVIAVPAKPEQKVSKWVLGEDDRHPGYYCSKCDFFVPWNYDYYRENNINFIKNYYYCPNCGAKMEGTE